MRFRNGDTLSGRYRVLQQVGCGAFGEVYRAESDRFGTVAVKVLANEFSPGRADLVLKEAVTLSELEHPNIVKVLEVGRHAVDGSACDYLVMEFLTGGTLAEYLERNTRLGIEDACRVGIEILQALACAHTLRPPVIHGDVKPGNILLVSEDPLHVKIGDFGLADRACSETGIASAVGTLYYLAPECFWGYSVPGSDVFSAALVIYQLLTGMTAFALPEASEMDSEREWRRVIEQSRQHTPPTPSTFNSEIDGQLDHVILQALALDHRDRYVTAVEFEEALAACAPGGVAERGTRRSPVDSACDHSIPIFGLEDYRLLAVSGELTQDELGALWDLYRDLESPILVDQGGVFSAVTVTGLTRTELMRLDGHSLSEWLFDLGTSVPELRTAKDIGKLMYSNPYSQRAVRSGKLLYAAAIAQGLDRYGERISALSVRQLHSLFADLLDWRFLPPKYRALLSNAKALIQ